MPSLGFPETRTFSVKVQLQSMSTNHEEKRAPKHVESAAK